MEILVALLDEIICQLLDCCCCVPGHHAVFVVGDEDGHFGLDNHNAFSALYPRNISQLHRQT